MTAPRVKLDIDATREKLGALGLSHALEALEGLLSDAVRSEMPAHAFLERLLEAERSGREERLCYQETMRRKSSSMKDSRRSDGLAWLNVSAEERLRLSTRSTGL